MCVLANVNDLQHALTTVFKFKGMIICRHWDILTDSCGLTTGQSLDLVTVLHCIAHDGKTKDLSASGLLSYITALGDMCCHYLLKALTRGLKKSRVCNHLILMGVL